MDGSKDYRRIVECGNLPVADMAMKCEGVFATHERVLVSISGGADSDVMLDLVERVRRVQPIDARYVFFDTGLEYEATRRHVDRLEREYGVTINRLKTWRTIPQAVRASGQPFVSKQASHQIETLQRNGFGWEDEPYDVLVRRYPNCKSAIRWWCDDSPRADGKPTSFGIATNRMLKQFMVENPPDFKISDKCCKYTKKMTGASAVKVSGCDLQMIGVRRAEGGTRRYAKTCFSPGWSHDGKTRVDLYKPLFWLKYGDRAVYEGLFGIHHSDCYETWGFKRTGCAGCPFNKNFKADNDKSRIYEPRVVAAAEHVFAQSYDYTLKWRRYQREAGAAG